MGLPELFLFRNQLHTRTVSTVSMLRGEVMSAKSKGFTLLEVLVALSILSIVGIYVIRACGDSLSQVADTGWMDQAARLGRSRMAEIVRNGIKNGMEGTFSPRYPRVSWRASVTSLEDIPGRRVEFTVYEQQGRIRHELVLEQILYP